MSTNNQQIMQSIRIIEEQLQILKRNMGEPAEQEGIVGVFDGEFMVEESGKRHQVPPNYASKTMLVPGDTIRMIEDKNGGQTKYKQIGKAERAKSSGVLVKKDGKYEVLTEDGSFKVLSASIKHYNGEVGDQVNIQFPVQHVKGSWAAVEKVINQNPIPVSALMPDVQSVLAESEVALAPEGNIQPAVQIKPQETLEQAEKITAPQDKIIASPERTSAAPRSQSVGRDGNAPNKSRQSNNRSSGRASASPSKNNATNRPQSTAPAASRPAPAPAAAPVAPSTPTTPSPEASFGDDDLI